MFLFTPFPYICLVHTSHKVEYFDFLPIHTTNFLITPNYTYLLYQTLTLATATTSHHHYSALLIHVAAQSLASLLQSPAFPWPPVASSLFYFIFLLLRLELLIYSPPLAVVTNPSYSRLVGIATLNPATYHPYSPHRRKAPLLQPYPTRPPTRSNKEKSRSIVAGARDRSIGLRFQELERRIKGEVGREA